MRTIIKFWPLTRVPAGPRVKETHPVHRMSSTKCCMNVICLLEQRTTARG
jgi:hypothetical protein